MRPRTWSKSLLNLVSHDLPPEGASSYERDPLLQRVNDARDEQALRKKDKAEIKRQKNIIKVLLLGQSESGKTMVLKQFQQRFAPRAFNQERAAWRAVIYLNLTSSVHRILDALVPPDCLPAYHSDANTPENDEVDSRLHTDDPNASSSQSLRFQRYVKHLSPLLILERSLIRQLAFPDEDDPPPTYDLSPSSLPSYVRRPLPTSQTRHTLGGEHALRPTSHSEESSSSLSEDESESAHSGGRRWWEDPRDPVHVLQQCVNGEYGVRALWGDVDVRSTLERHRVKMEDSTSFYLNDIDRITALRYIPTDDDVMRAYLKTTGVVEHSLMVGGTKSKEMEWRIYDVGGSRQQRQAWAQYYGDMDAIIFLAPVSVFDQTLAEDPRVNRLEDSMLLWRSLVSNKLLASTSIILLLTKSDLLKAKLEKGVSVTFHMPSYRDRPNEYKPFCEYLKRKFTAYRPSSLRRETYVYLTSFTSKSLPSVIVSCVEDVILRQHFEYSRML